MTRGSFNGVSRDDGDRRFKIVRFDWLKAQIDKPKLMGQYVEAYLAERRALSADARRDKVKITANGGCLAEFGSFASTEYAAAKRPARDLAADHQCA